MNKKYKVNTGNGSMNSNTNAKGWGGVKKNCKGEIAFTLIELMVVVAVIGVVASLVLAAAGGVQKKAARDRARAEIKSMMVALEAYRSARGAYPVPNQNPSTTALYSNLTNFMPFRSKNISGQAVLDPYGGPYWYRLVTNSADSGSGTINLMSETVEIWSAGPNFKSGLTNTPPLRSDTNNADDITSWN